MADLRHRQTRQDATHRELIVCVIEDPPASRAPRAT